MSFEPIAPVAATEVQEWRGESGGLLKILDLIDSSAVHRRQRYRNAVSPLRDG